MLDFLLDVLTHPFVFVAGLLLGALVPGIKLWLVKRAAALEQAAKSAAAKA